MENLPLLLKMVRDAQGISQSELSEKIGVSQSAIAQFEKMKATLSIQRLIRMAPILNLNPNYLQTGIGNPFRQTIKQKTIKMFFPEDPLGRIDTALVRVIIDANKQAEFFFLRPGHFDSLLIAKEGETVKKELNQWQRQRVKNTMLCALFVCDGDNNTFLFKRKNNRLFDNEELMRYFLRRTGEIDQKYFTPDTINLGLPECIEIIKWHDSPCDKLFREILRLKFLNDRTFVTRLLNDLWSRKEFLKDSRTYEKAMEMARGMHDDNLRMSLSVLVPRIAKVVEEIFVSSNDGGKTD
jgi:transcriptional regulator with XRE-family HTH domain